MSAKKRTSPGRPRGSRSERAKCPLKESELCFRGFFDNLLVGAAQVDARRQFIRVNRRFCEITGYSQAELLGGMGPEDLNHPEDWEEDHKSISRLIEGEGYETEKRYLRKDGQVAWVRVNVSPTFDAEGQFLCSAAVIEDISERKSAEEALVASNQRLQSVLSNIAQGYYALDRDWRVVAVNTTSERHFGKSASELNGATFEEATGGRIPGNVLEGIRQVMATGVPQHFEVESRVRPGTWAMNYIYPRDGGVEVYFTDITERKQAEEALREREKELRKVLETSATGLVRCSRDLRYRWSNAAFARLVGIPLKDVVGRPVVEVIGKRALDAYLPYIERVLLGEQLEFETEIGYPSGPKFVHVVITPDEEESGGIAGWFASITDITEQKALEREVVRAAEAEQQRVGSELHEGICQELIAAGFTAKGLQRRLEKDGSALASTMEALTMSISQTAAYARQLAHGMNPVVNVPDGLEHALKQFAIGTAERHQIDCRLKCKSPVMIHDPVINTQLFRIAQEAVHNAIKHSKATRIDVALTETDSDICLVVTDNGCSLPVGEDSSAGFGLRRMRYRAGLIHGYLSIQNRKGGGTEIICQVAK